MKKLILIILTMLCTQVSAKQNLKANIQPSSVDLALPLYEVGLVYGMGIVPDYPGSDQSRLRYIVVPTFFYRGTTFRRDREEGTRARFFRDKNLSFDLSFSGSFPTNAEDNRAREGMDDLDWLGEIGPRLLWTHKFGRYVWRIGLPIRGVVSTDFKITKFVGLNFNPSVSLRINHCFKENYRCFFGLDATWISGGVSDYFYSVEAKDVTANRAAYNASSGYLGTGFFTGIAMRFDRTFSAFTGISYNLFHRSKNVDSPLFKAKNAGAVFVGFSWYFYQSEENGSL